MSTFLVPKVNKDLKIPTKLSQLINDMSFVRDSDYTHTDNNFTDSYKSMLDNNNSSYEIITEAKNAADRANKAASVAENVTTNTPKVINKYWYIYNKETDIYESTGVKAEGESFKIVKSYASVSDMEADFNNPLINIGEFVIIDSNIQDPDNSKLYVKTENNYKYLTDMSGATGITGKSAYEIAVENGFIGTKEEWIASLSEDSKQAALLVESKLEQVDSSLNGLNEVKEDLNHLKTELTDINSEVRSAEEQRIANETARSEAETNRANAENNRASAELQRETLKNELTTLKEELTDTIDSANIKVENLENRVNNSINNIQSEVSTTLDEANAKIINLEVRGNTAADNIENALLNYENKISEVNQTISNATNTVNQLVTDSQSLINTHISDSTTQINEAIGRTETAIENANTATDNTNAAISNANTQAERAKSLADNPPKIINKYWCLYDETQGQYISTGILAEGQKGEMGTGVTIKGTLESEGQLPIEASEGDGYLINGFLYVYVVSGGNVESNPAWSNVGEIKGPKGDTAEVTKESVEAVLTGTITSHDHDEVYLKDANNDSKQYVRYNGNWVELNLSSVEPYNISYTNGQVITEDQYNELLNAILSKKRIMYDSTHTAILAMGNETYIRFDLISSLKWFAIQIFKEDLTVKYLGNDIASADDIYSLETKEFDHVPSESDTDYLIPNTEDLIPYKIGTFASYNGKLYQLYSLADSKADWREVVNRNDIITVNKASEELKQAIETLSAVEESGTVDDTTYNTLSTLVDSEQFYLNGKTYVVSKEGNVIKLTTNDSVITITDKIKTSVENSITNVDGNIVIKNNNATATISLTGDGTKFLNDKGEYITVESGIKKLTDEEIALIQSLLEATSLTDKTYNDIVALSNKGQSFYIDPLGEGASLTQISITTNDTEIIIYIRSDDYYSNTLRREILINKVDKTCTLTDRANYVAADPNGIIINGVFKSTDSDISNSILLKTSGDGSNILSDSGEYIPALTENQVDTKINQAVASVYKVKGSVDNYEALPSDAIVGDVYNLIDTGANYVCVSTDPITWDKLSETFDTSNVYTKSDITLVTNGDGTKFLNDSGNYIEVPTNGIIPLSEEDAVILSYFDADDGTLTEEQYNKVVEVYNKSKAWYYNNSLYFFTGSSLLTLYGSTFDGSTNLIKINIIESTKDYVKQISSFKVESAASKINISTNSTSITLDKSGDGTKFLNDAGEYTTIAGGAAEVAISSVKPSNNEVLWIDTATEGTSDVYNKEESDARYAKKDEVLIIGSNSEFTPVYDYDPTTKVFVENRFILEPNEVMFYYRSGSWSLNEDIFDTYNDEGNKVYKYQFFSDLQDIFSLGGKVKASVWSNDDSVIKSCSLYSYSINNIQTAPNGENMWGFCMTFLVPQLNEIWTVTAGSALGYEGAYKEWIRHPIVEASNILTKDNKEEYTPTTDYQPATKKYVDNLVAGGTNDTFYTKSETESAISTAVNNIPFANADTGENGLMLGSDLATLNSLNNKLRSISEDETIMTNNNVGRRTSTGTWQFKIDNLLTITDGQEVTSGVIDTMWVDMMGNGLHSIITSVAYAQNSGFTEIIGINYTSDGWTCKSNSQIIKLAYNYFNGMDETNDQGVSTGYTYNHGELWGLFICSTGFYKFRLVEEYHNSTSSSKYYTYLTKLY